MRERLVLISSVLAIVGLGAAFAMSALGGIAPDKVLLASAQKMEEQGSMSGRLNATVSMDGKPFMTMDGTMTSDLSKLVYAASLRLDIMSVISVQTNQITAPSTSVIQLPTIGQTWYRTGDSDDASAASDAATSAMNDQRAWLQQLSTASSITKVGTEQVAGRSVDHLRITMDGAAVSQAIGLAAKTSGDMSLSGVVADVWCDPETELPVREDVKFSMTAKGKTLDMNVSMTDLQFGVPVSIQVPDPAAVRPAAEMQEALKSLVPSRTA